MEGNPLEYIDGEPVERARILFHDPMRTKAKVFDWPREEIPSPGAMVLLSPEEVEAYDLGELLSRDEEGAGAFVVFAVAHPFNPMAPVGIYAEDIGAEEARMRMQGQGLGGPGGLIVPGG